MDNRLVVFLIVASIFGSYCSSAQTNHLNKLAKGFLYCHCVQQEYNRIDSNAHALYNNDYSESYFIQMTEIPLQMLDSLQDFYNRNIYYYRAIPQEYNPQNYRANMVSYTCWKFSESNLTKRFINLQIRTKPWLQKNKKD